MELSGCDYHVEGALQECFFSFYYFQYDFEILVREGNMRVQALQLASGSKVKQVLPNTSNGQALMLSVSPAGFGRP